MMPLEMSHYYSGIFPIYKPRTMASVFVAFRSRRLAPFSADPLALVLTLRRTGSFSRLTSLLLGDEVTGRILTSEPTGIRRVQKYPT